MRFLADFRIGHKLDYAGTVTQFDKAHAAMIADAVYPSFKDDGVADVFFVYFAAVACSFFTSDFSQTISVL